MDYLLLQVRNRDDPMLTQEVDCFARAFGCDQQHISVHNLLHGAPTIDRLGTADIVVLGGSGDYSVAEGGDWLPPALAAMRELYDLSKPTFASCWGFQAMARAMGGEVVTDEKHAELGSVQVWLTEAGQQDPLFAPLGSRFLAPMGHQDCVTRLPANTTLLASSEKVVNQAFRFDGKPIYCTQFHPELDRKALLERVQAYPTYVQRISRMSPEAFAQQCRETPETNQLLARFAQQVSVAVQNRLA
jgi:GMP synthase (glutamine-hydrolysing)